MTTNEQLRRARTDRGWTQARVAEELCLRLGKPDAVPPRRVGELERGRNRWPNTELRAAFRDLFSVTDDAALGFVCTRVSRSRVTVSPQGEAVAGETEADMRRRNVLTGGLGLAGLFGMAFGPSTGEALTDLVELAERERPPTTVGAAEVTQVRLAVNYAHATDNAVGGAFSRQAVQAQLRWGVDLLRADASTQVRRDLFGAVGHLAEVAGWMSHDAGHAPTADRYLGFALECAREAQDDELAALVLSDMARRAVVTGDPATALDLANTARVREHRLTNGMRGMLAGVSARAYAASAAGKDTTRAIGLAEDHYADAAASERDPNYPTYPNTAQLYGDTGEALYPYAIRGERVEEYLTRLGTAADLYPTGYERSRAFCLIGRAEVLLAHGDPAEGLSEGARALEAAASLKSGRALDRLRSLEVAAARVPEAADFRHRVAELISA